jgi:hypothetical protein
MTGVPIGHASVKLAEVTVSGAIASLNVAVIKELVATLLSPAAGLVELTVGAAVSATALVVKSHVVIVDSALPAES